MSINQDSSQGRPRRNLAPVDYFGKKYFKKVTQVLIPAKSGSSDQIVRELSSREGESADESQALSDSVISKESTLDNSGANAGTSGLGRRRKTSLSLQLQEPEVNESKPTTPRRLSVAEFTYKYEDGKSIEILTPGKSSTVTIPLNREEILVQQFRRESPEKVGENQEAQEERQEEFFNATVFNSAEGSQVDEQENEQSRQFRITVTGEIQEIRRKRAEKKTETENRGYYGDEQFLLELSHLFGRNHSVKQEEFVEDLHILFEPMAVHLNSDPIPQFFPESGDESREEFLADYEAWADDRGYNAHQKKLHFKKALPSTAGKAWWKSRKEMFEDDTIVWAQIKAEFKYIPMLNREDKLNIFDVGNRKQGKTECTRTYIQTMKAKLMKCSPNMLESEMVNLIIHNMRGDPKKYIIIRGKPLTYSNLEKMVKEYEEEDMQELGEVVVKQENQVFMAQVEGVNKTIQERMEKMSEVLEKVAQTLLTQSEVKENPQNSQSHGGNRNYDNRPKCQICGKLGHVASGCYRLGQNQGNRGGYNGGKRGNSYGNGGNYNNRGNRTGGNQRGRGNYNNRNNNGNYNNNSNGNYNNNNNGNYNNNNNGNYHNNNGNYNNRGYNNNNGNSNSNNNGNQNNMTNQGQGGYYEGFAGENYYNTNRGNQFNAGAQEFSPSGNQ